MINEQHPGTFFSIRIEKYVNGVTHFMDIDAQTVTTVPGAVAICNPYITCVNKGQLVG